MNKNKQWLELAQIRNINYPGLMSRISGFKGEDEFSTWLKKYGSKNWFIYTNLWLYNGYQGEIDFLIISPKKWLMIEVKNYEGTVTLGEEQSNFNEYLLERNPIEQVKRSLGVLRRIALQLPFKQEVEATLVFMNTHCHVVKNDACFGIPVYSRVQLKKFIQNLVVETQGSYYSQEQLTQVQRVIAKHQEEDPYGLIYMDQCDFSKMYRGFTCRYCLGHKISINHRHLKCHDCQKIEAKNQAVVRMVEDYCFLFKREEYTRHDIHDFIGGKLSLNSVGKLLHDQFNLVSGCRKKYYTNQRRT